MTIGHRSASPAVASRATAPVGGLSSGDRTGRPGGERGDGAVTAPASGPAPSDGVWAPWARPQLLAAVAIAAELPAGRRGAGLAAELHRSWYAQPVTTAVELDRRWGPLGGLYRRAHAGAPTRVDGISVVDRHDVLGRDGWWRTWGERWLPTRSRAGSVRLLLSPRPESLPLFTTTLTAALLDLDVPWLLSCATDVRRLRRAGAAQLHVPAGWTPADGLVARLEPLLMPVAPPLARPLGAGIAVVEDPDTGPTFGVHRCRVVAQGLRHPGGDPLAAVADAFAGHGLDPAAPHRTPR